MLVTMKICLQDKLSSALFQADYWPCLKILVVDIIMIAYLMFLLFVFALFLLTVVDQCPEHLSSVSAAASSFN